MESGSTSSVTTTSSRACGHALTTREGEYCPIRARFTDENGKPCCRRHCGGRLSRSTTPRLMDAKAWKASILAAAQESAKTSSPGKIEIVSCHFPHARSLHPQEGFALVNVSSTKVRCPEDTDDLTCFALAKIGPLTEEQHHGKGMGEARTLFNLYTAMRVTGERDYRHSNYDNCSGFGSSAADEVPTAAFLDERARLLTAPKFAKKHVPWATGYFCRLPNGSDVPCSELEARAYIARLYEMRVEETKEFKQLVTRHLAGENIQLIDVDAAPAGGGGDDRHKRIFALSDRAYTAADILACMLDIREAAKRPWHCMSCESILVRMGLSIPRTL